MGCFPGKNRDGVRDNQAKVSKKKEINKAEPGELAVNPKQLSEPNLISSDQIHSNINNDKKLTNLQANEEINLEKSVNIEGCDLINLGGSFVLKIFANTSLGKYEIGDIQIEKSEYFNMLHKSFKLGKVPQSEENYIGFKLEFIFSDGNTYKFKIITNPGARYIHKEFGINFELSY